MMPPTGVAPARPNGHRALNAERLLFRHSGIVEWIQAAGESTILIAAHDCVLERDKFPTVRGER